MKPDSIIIFPASWDYGTCERYRQNQLAHLDTVLVKWGGERWWTYCWAH